MQNLWFMISFKKSYYFMRLKIKLKLNILILNVYPKNYIYIYNKIKK